MEIQKDKIIESGIRQLRDPYVVPVGDTYYVYGTEWKCYYGKNLAGPWNVKEDLVKVPEDAVKFFWAPEVYIYNGSYYMITTYLSSKTGLRGCSVFKSDDPLGPFVEISDGHVTPHDSHSIDGTLYIDKEGKPWLIFVDEWIGNEDGVGKMDCARFSDDLTHLITEPQELFRADEVRWVHDDIPGSADWKRDIVTDGCWMYTTEKGSLLMLWSNSEWDPDMGKSYAEAIARSTTGLVTGPWVQEEHLLFSRRMNPNKLDGGHGMIFTGFDGRKYLSLHSPNHGNEERKESPIFIPVIEKDDTLVLDF